MTFQEWLKTEHGLKCNNQRTLTGQPYLRNRLWWAFQAGHESKAGMKQMNLCIKNLQFQIQKMKRELRKKRKTKYSKFIEA